MTNPMLKCGHSANATDGNGKPCCAICAPNPSAYQIVGIDLTGRKARCSYYNKPYTTGNRGGNECDTCSKQPDHRCHCERPSSTELAFFASHPDKEFDEFYCGCSGWD